MKSEVEDLMLMRNDDATKRLFHDTAPYLMDTNGGSYLAGVYLMNIQETGDQENTAFIPTKAKSNDTEKLAAYYRFTTTQLDLGAPTSREVISKQNYAKDECLISSIYDLYHDNLFDSGQETKPDHQSEHFEDHR